VIFLTAKSGVDDRIKGLKLGADDYIVKPFQIGELIARVEALLRRYGKINKRIVFADVEIDLVSRTVRKSGKPVDLTVKEFDLLVELIQNKNVALYRERLYEKVWGETYEGETRTLDSHIQRLRKKLDWDKYIKTVFRVGYRLEDGE
jgi:DNA-binding response OmpR family regulator